MTQLIRSSLLALAFIVPSPGTESNPPSPTATEILVKFKDGPASYAAWMGHAAVGAKVVRTFGGIGWQHVTLPNGTTLDEGLTHYGMLNTVTAVEPNHSMAGGLSAHDGAFGAAPSFAASDSATVAPPNDPRYTSQWPLRKIGATNAWAITAGNKDVVVAIIDTGVNYLHEDLRENMWRNPGESGPDQNGNDKATNGIDDDANGYIDDLHGIDAAGNDSDPMDEGVFEPRIYHGSFIAGQIAAVANNKKGGVGLAWSVQLMALRTATVTDVFRASDVIECFEYVLKMKRRGVNIRVTNNSYGGDNPGLALHDAMDAVGRAGILNVIAGGNAGVDADFVSGYPRSYPLRSSVVVGASNESDAIAANFGRTTLDLAAPGANMTSTWGPGTNSYYSFSGAATSFATPYVSAAVALLASANPALSGDQLKSAILNSVDVIPSMRGKLLSNGGLNIGRALQNLSSNLPPIVIDALPSIVRDPANASLSVTFSKSMNRQSVESAWRLTPATTGSFEWSEDDRTVTFRPHGSLEALTNYTATILGTSLDGSGASLDGSYDRTSQGSPADDFVWGFRLPPANDDAIHAQSITGSSGELKGSNRNASHEGRESVLTKGGNVGGSSVWYRWVAPETGSFTFDTAGSAFDTLLAVALRTPDSPDRDMIRSVPSYLASNNNDGALKSSRVSFVATAGTTYNFVVDGVNIPGTYPRGAAGEFTLRWQPTPQRLQALKLASGELQISWPSSAPGWILESADQLAAQAAWSQVAATPLVAGSRKSVLVDPNSPARFFRLRKP